MAAHSPDHSDLSGPDFVSALSGSACPINTSLGAEVGSAAIIKAKYSEPCLYWNYIHPEKITSLQTGREGKGLNHHDEHLFIVVHQAFELWFKQVLHELDWVRDTFEALVEQGEVPTTKPITLRSYEDVRETFSIGTTLRLLIHRVRRADTILRIATHGFDAMETMEPMDFLEFRDFLIPASGFQSVQLRELEIVIGLQDEDRLRLNNQHYTQQFQTDKDDLTPILRKRIAQPSMRTSLYTCLAHMSIPDRDGFTDRFLKEKAQQYETKSRDLQAKMESFRDMQRKMGTLSRESCDELYDSVLKSASVLEVEKFMEDHGLDHQASSRIGTIALKLCKVARDAPKGGKPEYTKEQLFQDMTNFNRQDQQMAAATIAHISKNIDEANAEYNVVRDFFYSNELIHKVRTGKPSDKYTLGEARRAVLYLLSHPWTQPREGTNIFECTEWSLLLSTVLKLEQAVLLWRSRHARMVELMIGRRTGTGGSSGVEYLDKTQVYRVYQDLWRIRALLVPASALK